MRNFLRQCLMTKSTKFRREKFVVAIVYWNFHYAKLTDDDQLIQWLFFSWLAFAKSFSLKQYENLTIASNAIYVCYIRKFCRFDHWRYSCILTDFLLILSNMNFSSFVWFWIVLHSNKIRSRVFVENTCYCRNRHEISSWRECIVMFLLKSSFDQLLIVFWLLMIRKKKTNEIVAFELFRWFEYKIWKTHFA